jgi:tripartite-type tricarboxylate transporter receptor subunit TctC
MKSTISIQGKLLKTMRWMGLAAFGAVVPMASGVAAETFPTQPVTLIVPYSPGGGTDVLARIIAKGLEGNLGQSVIVDNRPGAGGTIGAAIAAQAPADGYTVLILNAIPHTSSAGLYSKLSYDPVKSFTAIGSIAETPYVLVAGPSIKAKTFKEFIEYARANPGKVNYASSGIGGVSHLTTELFKSMSKLQMRHVPYKGDGPSITDLLGGYVDINFGNMLAMMPHIKTHKMKAFAVTSAERSTILPDVPTVAESGYPDFVVVGRFGLAAPAGTPPDIISRLSDALAKTVKSTAIVDQLNKQGVDPKPSTAKEFNDIMNTESAKWLGVIRDVGIKAQ